MISACEELSTQVNLSRWCTHHQSDERGATWSRDVDKRLGRHLHELKSRARAEHPFEEDSEDVARGVCNIGPKIRSKFKMAGLDLSMTWRRSLRNRPKSPKRRQMTSEKQIPAAKSLSSDSKQGHTAKATQDVQEITWYWLNYSPKSLWLSIFCL